MTVSSQTNNETFHGNGITTIWDLPFRFFDNSDIKVYLNDPLAQTSTPLAIGTDYTLTGAGLPEQFGTAPGKITTIVPVASGKDLYVERVMEVEQLTDLVNQGRFFAEVHEDVFDRLTMYVQQANAGIGNSIQLDKTGNFWDFKGHRGVNAADPINPQDVATKNWVGTFIDSVSGLINTTLGIAYDGGTLFDYLRFGVARTVDSITALKALSGARNQRAFVLGFDDKGDGGGGEYFIRPGDTTSAEIPGFIVVGNDGSRWQLIYTDGVSLKQFGAKGTWNGTTGANDTAAIQAAFNSGVQKITVPSVPAGFAYQTTAPISVTKATGIWGESVVPYTALSGVNGGANTRGPGSWFHLNHAGKGFVVNTGSGAAGPEFRGIGTVRNHATPGLGAFTATVADWDFDINNTVDVKFIDVCLLNPYKGIYSHGGQTRMWVERLYGQPMKEGIRCEECFDIHRFNNVHFWPFWSQNTRTWTYTKANLDAFLFGRCDGFMLSNVFSIFHSRGMLIYGSASGTANKLTASNLFLDQGKDGYVVDSSATGHTAMLSNVALHGETGIVGDNYGLAVFANQVDMSICNANISNVNSYAIYVAGQFCNIGIHDVVFLDWALSNNTLPAINVTQANTTLWIEGSKRFYSNNGNVAGRYSGTGIHTTLDRGTFSGSTNASGDIVITFSGNSVPTIIDLTNLTTSSISFATAGRTLSSVTVRCFNGVTPLASTVVSVGWEMSI